MVVTPVPPFGLIRILPLQLPVQVGLLLSMVGVGRLGGPGTTKTVSGPNPAPALQLDQPALHVGYTKWQVY
jgi:hypothetical protein